MSDGQPLPPFMMDVLNDVRIVDFSTGISGAYATKLFVDAGADVVKVEGPGGDPYRRCSESLRTGDGADSALFRYLNAGKSSVIGVPGEAHIDRLVDMADLLVESFVPRPAAIVEARENHPALVVLSLTPWGTQGPWRDRVANDFIVQAESGSIAIHGHPDEVPYQIGGRLGEWCAGTFGAVGALAAVSRARRTGGGEHVDCSWQAATTYATSVALDAHFAVMGEPMLDKPARYVDLPSIEPTSDGWVGFALFSRTQFENFLLLIERPDLLADEQLFVPANRRANRAAWDAIVHGWTKQHTTAEVVELGSALRIPVTAVNDARAVLEHSHFRERGVFVRSDDGAFEQPLPPFLFNGRRISPPKPAPALGEHTSLIQGRWSPRVRPALRSERLLLPYARLRVLDATSNWAGPAVGQAFAALGADVIHVESIGRIDQARGTHMAPHANEPQWWERSGSWLSKNTNKRSLTLDLAAPEGRELFAALLGHCDVLVENYSPRVFEGFGFGVDAVKAINPGIVYARLPAFGLSGPWRDRTGFSQTMEQATGLAWLTGHPSGSPRILNGPCDPIAGYHTAFAVMVGLAERERTGLGTFIESPMAEAVLNVAAAQIVDHAYGTDQHRSGNRSPHAAPQGIYRCVGNEDWLALSIETDTQWKSLKAVLGSPTWAEDPSLDDADGRASVHDLIDTHLSEWARGSDLESLVAELAASGVPVGRVVDPRLMSQHPQLVAHGHYEMVDHQVAGSHLLPSVPFRFRGVERFTRSPAPLLGEHNDAVLRELLNLDEEAIEGLRNRAVIGDWPAGVVR